MFQNINRKKMPSLKNVYTSPDFKKYQENFETRLGVYAFHHQKSYAAVNKGLDKMKKVLYKYYSQNFQEIEKEEDRQLEIYLRAFTRDDPSSAGQVGVDVQEGILDILKDTRPPKPNENQVAEQVGIDVNAGNLREKMTAFYNAAYYNPSAKENIYGAKYHDTNITFKDIITKIANGEDNLINDLELDRDSISENKRLMSKNPFVAGLGTAILNMIPKHHDVLDYTKYAFNSLDKEDSYIRSTFRYKTNKSENYDYKDLDYAENLGIGRSAREKALQKIFKSRYKGKSSIVSGNTKRHNYDSGFRGWLSGGTKLAQKGFLFSSGNSGTTVRMLNVYKWLGFNNQSDLLDFRLALIGWMLPEQDHTLYEILKGSHTVGVRGNEDMTDADTMDKSVSPLTTQEIMDNCGKTITLDDSEYKMLPVDEFFMSKFSDFNPDTNLSNLADNKDAYAPYFKDHMSPALKVYVGPFAYDNMNTNLNFKHFAGEKLGNFLFKITNRKKFRSLLGDDKYNNKEINMTNKDLEITSDLLTRHLYGAQKYNGIVYRGSWIAPLFSKYKENATITHHEFTSTSKSLSVAKEFQRQQINKGRKTSIILADLKGYSGVDISSVNPQEAEVLLMPEARFKVNHVKNISKNKKFIKKLSNLRRELSDLEKAKKNVIGYNIQHTEATMRRVWAKYMSRINVFIDWDKNEINDLKSEAWSSLPGDIRQHIPKSEILNDEIGLDTNFIYLTELPNAKYNSTTPNNEPNVQDNDEPNVTDNNEPNVTDNASLSDSTESTLSTSSGGESESISENNNSSELINITTPSNSESESTKLEDLNNDIEPILQDNISENQNNNYIIPYNANKNDTVNSENIQNIKLSAQILQNLQLSQLASKNLMMSGNENSQAYGPFSYIVPYSNYKPFAAPETSTSDDNKNNNYIVPYVDVNKFINENKNDTVNSENIQNIKLSAQILQNLQLSQLASKNSMMSDNENSQPYGPFSYIVPYSNYKPFVIPAAPVKNYTKPVKSKPSAPVNSTKTVSPKHYGQLKNNGWYNGEKNHDAPTTVKFY